MPIRPILQLGNPRLYLVSRPVTKSEELMEVWDDCMSFPDLLIRVLRHQSCRIRYRNLNWEKCTMDLHGDLSDLRQHEYDHLEGILAVSRAIDGRSFALRSQRSSIETS